VKNIVLVFTCGRSGGCEGGGGTGLLLVVIVVQPAVGSDQVVVGAVTYTARTVVVGVMVVAWTMLAPIFFIQLSSTI